MFAYVDGLGYMEVAAIDPVAKTLDLINRELPNNVPPGGLTNELLTKVSDTDYDVRWGGTAIVRHQLQVGQPGDRDGPAGTNGDFRIAGSGTLQTPQGRLVFNELNRNQVEFAVSKGAQLSGNAEATLVVSVGDGGWGWREAFRTEVASPPNLSVAGQVKAGGIVLTSDAALKENIADLAEPDHHVIESLHPRKFNYKPEEWTGLGPAPVPPARFGLIVQEIEAMHPELITTVQTEHGEVKGYSLDQLVTLMLDEVLNLRARVAQLEGPKP
jgi:hypothetical protein